MAKTEISTSELMGGLAGEALAKKVDKELKESLIDPKLWVTEILRDASKPTIFTSGTGGYAGPLRLSGIVKSEEPLKSILHRQTDEFREKCLEILLICLPRGYGFIPILVPLSTNIELAFGKLGYDKYVHVIMDVDPEVRFQIVGSGRQFLGDEVRLLILEILDRIHEINGIDDEQDAKGSE